MVESRWLLRLITRLHRWLYRVTDGRIGNRLGAKRFLLLTHIGRRTGTRRETPLLYVNDAEQFVVVASNAGDDRDPEWLRNLNRTPLAEIQVGREHYPVSARQADAKESESLWPVLARSYRHYPAYRKRARREIPIVILERAA